MSANAPDWGEKIYILYYYYGIINNMSFNKRIEDKKPRVHFAVLDATAH